MIFKFNNKEYIFQTKAVPFLAFVVALSILLGLSTWQFKRLKWKSNLIDIRISMFEGEVKPLKVISEPSKSEFQKISVKGKFLNEFEFYMPALSKKGNNGFHILVPFQTLENKFIIFDTGWVPLLKKDRDKRINNIDNREKEFIAIIRVPGRKGYFQPENDPLKNFWFFVEPTLMEKQLKFSLEKNFYLEAFNNGPNGFPLGNQTRIYLRNNHLQYALTWLMIALGLIGVYFFASIKKK